MIANQRYSILLFVQDKEMYRNTRKRSKGRRRTLRRKKVKGGSNGQALAIPTAAFKNSPVNSDNQWHKIA